MTRQQLLEQARHLPASERADLAVEIWETVEGDEAILSPEMCAALNQRIAEDDADPTPAEPWDVVRARLLRGEV